MLSRTARLAAVLTIASAGLALTTPIPAFAAAGFDCGDPGLTSVACLPDRARPANSAALSTVMEGTSADVSSLLNRMR